MTRGSVTQTRSWNYDSTTQRLTSFTTPEGGTTSFTYNADGTVATRTDAKGQKQAFTYDSFKRVTQIARYPNGLTEDTCQRVTFSYDTNPYDATFSQNAKGRLTASQYGGTSCTASTLFTEMYSYTAGGRVTSKRLPVAARVCISEAVRVRCMI
jgi:YD repeat-containing protein